MQLAAEIARLAEVTERTLERAERLEREARHEQLREEWGSGAPKRAGLALFLRAIPGLAAKFDVTVPDDFVAQIDAGVYEIACPCGLTPSLSRGELAGCACGRWFLHDGHDVHVALSPRGVDTPAPSDPSIVSEDAESTQTGP